MTLDQIEEVRKGLQPSQSLQQVAWVAGLPFEQCTECHGRGFTKATLMASGVILAKLRLCTPIPIQYDRCGTCGGSGGFIRS